MTPATPFAILPAIDLRGGRVVRLQQGDFARETVYGDDPVAVAVAFAVAGATWLHVVDLDGALAGEPRHTPTVAAIVEAVGGQVRVEVAGGLRSAEAVAAVLATGAARAVVGTMAIRDPMAVGRLVAAHGAERIAVAIDVRDGHAVGQGWVAGADRLDALEAIARLVDVGVRTFELTAIDRDGLLGGPDLALYVRALGSGAGAIVASGGIATAADIAAVRRLGCAGAIVGRALYDGSLSLRDVSGAVEAE